MQQTRRVNYFLFTQHFTTRMINNDDRRGMSDVVVKDPQARGHRQHRNFPFTYSVNANPKALPSIEEEHVALIME